MPQTINVTRQDRIVTVTLNRPGSLNSINGQMLSDILEVLLPLDRDPSVGCIIVTGSEKSFAAGADIREVEPYSYIDMLTEDYFCGWEQFAKIRTPKIAAVSGYALGGGCELALMCDVVIAAENAKFGLPEIKLGVIPGIGGSQRLTRLIGRAKAMDLILTGRTIGAEEAERSGLVSRVVPTDKLLQEAQDIAETISSYSKPSTLIAKEAVNRAEETGLSDGLLFERRLFHSLFATTDQKEGMRAFAEKRKPNFQGT